MCCSCQWRKKPEIAVVKGKKLLTSGHKCFPRTRSFDSSIRRAVSLNFNPFESSTEIRKILITFRLFFFSRNEANQILFQSQVKNPRCRTKFWLDEAKYMKIWNSRYHRCVKAHVGNLLDALKWIRRVYTDNSGCVVDSWFRRSPKLHSVDTRLDDR